MDQSARSDYHATQIGVVQEILVLAGYLFNDVEGEELFHQFNGLLSASNQNMSKDQIEEVTPKFIPFDWSFGGKVWVTLEIVVKPIHSTGRSKRIGVVLHLPPIGICLHLT